MLEGEWGEKGSWKGTGGLKRDRLQAAASHEWLCMADEKVCIYSERQWGTIEGFVIGKQNDQSHKVARQFWRQRAETIRGGRNGDRATSSVELSHLGPRIMRVWTRAVAGRKAFCITAKGPGGCPRDLNFWHQFLCKFGRCHGVKAHHWEIKLSSIFNYNQATLYNDPCWVYSDILVLDCLGTGWIWYSMHCDVNSELQSHARACQCQWPHDSLPFPAEARHHVTG